MIVIKGIRRIGKSSLIRVGLKLYSLRLYAIFDARAVPILSSDTFNEVLSKGLTSLLERASGLRKLLVKTLARVKGVSIAGLRVEIEHRAQNILADIASTLSEAASRAGEPLVLVFDEAQEFNIIPGFSKLLAHIYDYTEGVKIVLAGSEIGLLDRLIGVKNPKAPLYGRPYLEIKMPRLNRNQAIEFLEKGFKELGLEWPKDSIEEAVRELDGIPGWLTAYGYYSYTTRNHEKALAKVVEEGAQLAWRELESFLQTRKQAIKRYLTILRCLAIKPMKWKELKTCLETQIQKTLNQSQYTRYLHELQDYSFIEKTIEGNYKLADPLLKHALTKHHPHQ